QIEGKIARNSLVAGKPIPLKSLSNAIAVQKGHNVTIIYERGPMSIKLNGTAVGEGSIGDTVKVKNNSTNKVFTAKIIADNVVKLDQ
ncbi:MAG: flagellar basal body P-ring formation chaperone FlgA, partial [Pseudomonadota bacterium]